MELSNQDIQKRLGESFERCGRLLQDPHNTLDTLNGLLEALETNTKSLQSLIFIMAVEESLA